MDVIMCFIEPLFNLFKCLNCFRFVGNHFDFCFPVCPFFTSASSKIRHTHAQCKHRRNTAENISFCHIPLSFFCNISVYLFDNLIITYLYASFNIYIFSVLYRNAIFYAIIDIDVAFWYIRSIL